jgi:hypothetical protein
MRAFRCSIFYDFSLIHPKYSARFLPGLDRTYQGGSLIWADLIFSLLYRRFRRFSAPCCEHGKCISCIVIRAQMSTGSGVFENGRTQISTVGRESYCRVKEGTEMIIRFNLYPFLHGRTSRLNHVS